MMKWAKRIGCALVVLLLVLVIVAVVGVQVVLKNYLGKVLNDTVFPKIEDKLKVDLALKDASVNLLGGSVHVSGLKVGNPQGFKEPSLFALNSFVVDIGVGRLVNAAIHKQIDLEISKVEVKDAEITLVRNAEKKINVKVLADTLQAGKKDKPPAEKPVEPPVGEKPPADKKAPGELPKVWMKTLEINAIVRYFDYPMGKGDTPLDLALKAAIDLKNISTYRTEAGDYGDIRITGNLARDANLCVTDLKGKIAPITDPLKVTFDLAGDIGSIDLTFVMPYLAMAGISSCQSVSLSLNIVCKDGVFDGDKSVISLTLKNVALSGDMAKSIPGVSVIPSLTLPLPLSGTVAEPKVPGLGTILPKAIKENLKNNAGSVIKGAAGSLLGGKGSEGGSPLGGLLKGTGGETSATGTVGGAAEKPGKKEAGDALKKIGGLPF